jgi:acetyltransferase-like isoleucine patch superfamily enzyme
LYLVDDDYHKLIDNTTGETVNAASNPVNLGNHIWIGNNVVIVKNVTIGDDAVIGMHSLVTKSVPANCLAIGSPAIIAKENINWEK